MAAYLRPIERPPDPRIIAISRALTRAELAVYFLHQALASLAGPALPPIHSAEAALALFANNFPEFSNGGLHDVKHILEDFLWQTSVVAAPEPVGAGAVQRKHKQAGANGLA